MVLFSFRFSHHGKYSSYHRLVDYSENGENVIDATLSDVFNARYLNYRGFIKKHWRRLKEKEAWRVARETNAGCVHYLYPEHTYFKGKSLRRPDQKIIFSCHLPQAVLEAVAPTLQPFVAGLKETDGIIVMSPQEIEFYSQRAPQAKVEFIPHGIDVHYFKPSAKTIKRADDILEVLTVGNMERDFACLAKVIRRSIEMAAPLRFTVVASEDNLKCLAQMVGMDSKNSLRLLSRIDNNALLKLYHYSDLLFLPLRSATANNALLEALATGLPMLLPDLEACKAYARECSLYFPVGIIPENLVERMIALRDERERLEVVAKAGRSLAENELSWEMITSRHKEFARSIGASD